MENDEMMVAEYCNNCETEIEMRWDIKTMGYKAFCPVCGERLMLCDECQHRGESGECTGDCDYDSKTDICRFNKTPHQNAGAWISVKDRLPIDEKSNCVLTTVIAATEYEVKPLEYGRETVRGKTVYRWRYPQGRIYNGEPVTYWMPLPKLPEGEDMK